MEANYSIRDLITLLNSALEQVKLMKKGATKEFHEAALKSIAKKITHDLEGE